MMVPNMTAGLYLGAIVGPHRSIMFFAYVSSLRMSMPMPAAGIMPKLDNAE